MFNSRIGRTIERNLFQQPLPKIMILLPLHHLPSSKSLWFMPSSSCLMKVGSDTYLMSLWHTHHFAEHPKIIIVKCCSSQVPSQGMCPQPLISGHFSDGQAKGLVLKLGLSGEPLRFPLHLWYSPTALSRCAPINCAIYHITSGAAAKVWCGTVVVLKFNGSHHQGYSDARLNDLPALSAYFLAYK